MKIILYVTIRQLTAHTDILAAMRSEDGRAFYNMKAVIPELPPYRYEGHIKNLGAQYMRGICDYNDAFDKMCG